MIHSPLPRFVQCLADGEAQRLVVFGTSLSFHYAPILRVALQRRYGGGSEVINSGLPGKASRTALQALSEKVLRHHPNALMMEWAINDAHSYFHEPDALDAGISVEESRANLLLLIERMQNALPGCEILLWTTNPTFDAPHSSMRGATARPQLALYYQVVREVASARGLSLWDGEEFWKSLGERDEARFRAVVADGVHPTPKGWREEFVPFLERAWRLPDEKP